MIIAEPRPIRPWIVFGGCVLVIFVLDWAEPVLLPAAVAVLLTFLLNPPVTALQRTIGRPAAVMIVVSLVFCALAVLAWGLTRQVTTLAGELPAYRQNIRQKVADIRDASRGGAVESVQSTLEEIKTEMERGETAKKPTPVAVVPESLTGLTLPVWVSALAAPLATAGLVAVLVIFMLLEHRDMRDRLAGLIGQGYLATTTKALEEAATRVSHYLLMQSLVNLIYGVMVGAGLWWFGVPYPLLFAAMGAALRFIPYVGPFMAAAGPILIALAALPGWTSPLYVVALFIAIELFTNLVLETFLYSGAAGVTQVALLMAVAFWTWLWGPLGLLLSTPLTVCLVVVGKHVPGFRFLATLIADQPALSRDAMLYQRLLAREPADAWDVVERELEQRRPDEVYDSVLLPALAYAERDRIAGGLSLDEERDVVTGASDVLAEIDKRLPPAAGADGETADRLRILGYPVESAADEVALQMLARLLRGMPVSLEIASSQMLIAEMISLVREQRFQVVCLADLPPSPSAKSRYIVKRLRQAAPETAILVGRWGPMAAAADDPAEPLLEAGATHVARTLAQTTNQIRELAAPIEPPASAALPDTPVTAAGM